MNKRETERGVYQQDPSGLWHYSHTRAVGTTGIAAGDALKHRPEAAAWFWFNGTPRPIFLQDDVDSLLLRWSEWRRSYQTDATSLLRKMAELCPSR